MNTATSISESLLEPYLAIARSYIRLAHERRAAGASDEEITIQIAALIAQRDVMKSKTIEVEVGRVLEEHRVRHSDAQRDLKTALLEHKRLALEREK